MTQPLPPWANQPQQQQQYPPQPGQMYQQQPQYAPPQGQSWTASQGSGDDYDFGALHGQADNSQVQYEGWHDAVVTEAEYGRSKSGTKGQWTIKFRTTTGENAGKMPVIWPLTINDDNPRSLGIMFRHLAALGVPVPDPNDATRQRVLNGQQPFWTTGWKGSDVARHITGRPCQIKLRFDSEFNNNKVSDVRPPRPGAPTDYPREGQQPQLTPVPGQPSGGGWQQQQQQQYPPQQQAYAQGGGGGGGGNSAQMPPGSYGQGGGGGGWQPQQGGYNTVQTAPQPQPQPQQGSGGQGSQYAQQMPPQPWQAAQQPQAVPQQPQQYAPQPGNPAAPAWAQPGTPGQGGMGEFTPQGASVQPSVPGAQGPQNGQPPQQPQQAEQGPPLPPWAQ